MKRRSLIKLFGALTGGAVLLPAGLYFASPDMKEYARDLIFKELDYLKLESRGVARFVDDYFKADSFNLKNSLRWKYYYFSRMEIGKSDNLFQLVKIYLLSTDFFIRGADVETPVQYLGLFNPYKSSMPNPFSYIFLNKKP